MQKMSIVAACGAIVLAITGCSSDTSTGDATSDTRSSNNPGQSSRLTTVVIVSGGGAVSPFTTPTESCKSGLAAGSTDTTLRQHLLDEGYDVYTSPAQLGSGTVTSQEGSDGFSNCPEALPESMTVDATDDINLAGQHLSAFLAYLHENYDVNDIGVVAHSMGGLYTRSAIRQMKESGSPVTVQALVTLGTPWQGAFPSDILLGDLPMSACRNDQACLDSVSTFAGFSNNGQLKMGQEGSDSYLMGKDGQPGWNEQQTGVLDGIPVTLVAGTYAEGPSDFPRIWPNDALVAENSALARNVSDTVLPHRACFTRPDVHSTYYTNLLNIDQQRALTVDDDVMDIVSNAMALGRSALDLPNRAGC